MAEGTLPSIASGLLALISSRPLRRGFRSEELEKFRQTIVTIRAVVLDSEECGVQSPAVNAWITDLRDVLYSAYDLFDEIATYDLSYRQQMEGAAIPRRALLFLSRAASSSATGLKLKALRKSLDKISKDAASFNFASHPPYVEPTARIRIGVGTGSSMDQDLVVGRSQDLESILASLFDVANVQDNASIVVIVGMGGIGKTTLAQLVYNSAEVQNRFKARWWADVSLIYDEAEIIRSIFQSITGESCHGNSPTMNDKFLLVIDGLKVKIDFAGQNLRSLLTGNARGSKIIVTTRDPNVVSEFKAARIHQLNGLSGDSSWELFKRIAFTREQENDPRWCNIGRRILKKCANNPLAIRPIRHLSVGYKIPSDWEIPPSVPASLRSVLFMCGGLLSLPVLEQLLTRFKLLRAIDLQHLNLEELPNSIGKLLHLRYLNLSGNKFRNLPNSITELLNLVSLDVSSCVQLEALPRRFFRLIKLRHLNCKKCDGLRYMPPKFEALTSLQQLSYFKVGKVISGVNSSRLDALGGLKLQGQLQIMFDSEIANWGEDECWSLPTTLQKIKICSYPGMRLPLWWPEKVVSPSLLPKLLRVHIHDSSTIKYLSPLRSLPYLKTLHLSSLMQLTYVEEEQDERESGQLAAGYSMLFFPCLEELMLTELPRVMGWSREVAAVTMGKHIAAEEHSSCRDPSDQMPSFPLLSNLKIENCTKLKSVPPSSSLRTLELQTTSEELIQYLLSTCSHSLETIAIRQCDSLDSFPGETLTSLRHLDLSFCHEVKNLHLPQHNVLEELVIRSCPQLKLQDLKEGSVDWDSLINLKVLSLDEIPDPERLSVYLRKHTNIGKLQIKEISSKSLGLWTR